MKLPFQVLFFALLLTLGLVSCDKTQWLDREDYQSSTTASTEAPELLLSLESTLGKESRSLSFDQSNPLTPTVSEEGIEVLCIVRSDDPADQPIYRTITWAKDPNVPNRIYLRNYRFRLLPSMQLAGKRWYVMGLIGGEWDEANKQLRLSTNAISTTEVSSPVSLNVPAISPWVELPTNEIPDPQVYRYTLVPFQAQGALIHHKIERNDSDHDVTARGFLVVSTAFCFGGHYDLSPSQLPAVGAPLGHKQQDQLNFVPETPTPNKEYAHTHSSTPEYHHDFAYPQPLVVKANSAGNASKVATFWVMPLKPTTAPLRTNIFLRAEIAGQLSPSVHRLPTYGRHHTSAISNGSATPLRSVIVRPKLAIEYMAEYNMKRNETPQPWDKAGDRRNLESSRQMATSHGLEAGTGATWDAAKSHGIAGHHLPTPEEWRGIIPFGKTNDQRLNLKPAGTAGEAPGTQTPTTLPVQVRGEMANVGFQIKNVPEEKTSYAIHFTEDATGNKRRVAYRYRSIPNPAFGHYLGTIAQRVEVNYQTQLLGHESTSGTPTRSIESVDYLEIQMIYLGPYFLGTIEDIATSNWWDSPDRKQDLVARYLPANGNRYMNYLLWRQMINERQRKSLYDAILPWTMLYWLDSPETLDNTQLVFQPGRNPEVPEEDKKSRSMFYYSPTVLLTASPNVVPIMGGMVRLFTDQ